MLLLCVSLDVSDAHRYSWALPVALCNSAKCSFPAVAFPKIFVLCFCFSRARRGRRQRMQVGQCPSVCHSSKTSFSRAGVHARPDPSPAKVQAELSGGFNQNSARSRTTLKVLQARLCFSQVGALFHSGSSLEHFLW